MSEGYLASIPSKHNSYCFLADITMKTLYQDFVAHDGLNDFGFNEDMIRKTSSLSGLSEYLNTSIYNLPVSQAILTYLSVTLQVFL